MKPTSFLLPATFSLLATVSAFAQTEAKIKSGAPKEKSGHSFLNRLDHISIAAGSSHTAMPFKRFSALFTKEYHPGFELGTGLTWKNASKHDWIQTMKIQYSYHRFIQHSLALYTETGYRYKLPAGFTVGGLLGFGYLYVIEDAGVFQLKESGEYEPKRPGKSHTMTALTFTAARAVGKQGTSIFFSYQQRFQLGFIRNYVPALPMNSAMFGASFQLNNK